MAEAYWHAALREQIAAAAAGERTSVSLRIGAAVLVFGRERIETPFLRCQPGKSTLFLLEPPQTRGEDGSQPHPVGRPVLTLRSTGTAWGRHPAWLVPKMPPPTCLLPKTPPRDDAPPVASRRGSMQR